MEKQNIIDGIRLIVIIGVFIFMVIGSYRNIINSVVLPQNKVIKISPVKTKDLLISVDGENNIYTDVLYVQTVIQNKIIKCLRNKEYNFIDKINEKFIK